MNFSQLTPAREQSIARVMAPRGVGTDYVHHFLLDLSKLSSHGQTRRNSSGGMEALPCSYVNFSRETSTWHR